MKKERGDFYPTFIEKNQAGQFKTKKQEIESLLTKFVR